MRVPFRVKDGVVYDRLGGPLVHLLKQPAMQKNTISSGWSSGPPPNRVLFRVKDGFVCDRLDGPLVHLLKQPANAKIMISLGGPVVHLHTECPLGSRMELYMID